MKRWRPLLLLGVIAFALFAVVTLPASVLASRFESAGMSTAGVSGTLWRGRAEVLVLSGMRIGAIEWRLRPLQLLAARLKADVKITRVDGFLQAAVAARPSGRIEFDNLTGSLPLNALPPNVIRGGWAGALNLKLAALAIDNGWPVALDGTVEAVDLTGPADNPANIGSYKVTFAPDANSSEVLTGALTDMGGALQVEGSLQLRAANRGYLVEGLIAPRKDAPRSLVNTLQMLGAPDEQGRRTFGIEGTL